MIGSQYIELLFQKDKKARVIKDGEYELLPTAESGAKESITDRVNALLAKLQNLPLEKLLLSLDGLVNENREPIGKVIKNLDKTIINFNKTVNNLNSFTAQNEFNQLPKNLNSSLKELESTLINLQQLSSDYSGDSKFADQLSVTLKSVSEASNSFDKINKMLDRNANALVVGDD
jgi:paraquat-inducible protein B